MLAFALDNASPCTVQRQYIGNEFFRASWADIPATAQMFNFLNLFIMKFKIEVDGGHLNGAQRYYKTWKGAKNAANNIVRAEKYEDCMVDLYTVEDNGIKTFIGTILN